MDPYDIYNDEDREDPGNGKFGNEENDEEDDNDKDQLICQIAGRRARCSRTGIKKV